MNTDTQKKRPAAGVTPVPREPQPPAKQQHEGATEEHEGATEDQTGDRTAPAGSAYEDEPRQG
jgi:hypothetical protein